MLLIKNKTGVCSIKHFCNRNTLVALLLSSTLFACSSTDEEVDPSTLVAELTEINEAFEFGKLLILQTLEPKT